MANLLLLTQGTDGDVLPFVRLGRALHARGHRVTLLTHGDYAGTIQGAGLAFVALDAPGSRAEEAALDLAINTPQALLARMRRHLPRAIADYTKLRDHCGADQAVLIWNHTSVLAADLAGETLGLPLLPVFLSPSQLATVPLMREILCSTLGDDVNRVRAQAGLPPVRAWDNFMRYAAGGLAFWPQWFAPPAAEALPGVARVGFMLDHAAPLAGDLQAFFDHGEPPILIAGSTGTLVGAAQFFHASLEGCASLGRRGIVVSRSRDLLPAALPGGITWFPYLPFADVIPRTAAVIHHGGIGTTAQALAAGVPQLVLAAALDRPDNATHVQRLGAGLFLAAPKWEPAAVAEAIGELLGSAAISTRCRELAAWVGQTDALAAACDQIERLIDEGELRSAIPLREQAYADPAAPPEPKERDGLPAQLKALSEKRLELLARLVAQKTGRTAGRPAIPRQPRTDEYHSFPLSFAQQRLWFLDQLVPNHAFYNLAWALRLAGRLDLGVLRACLDMITRRHEALRTTFPTMDAGQPVQLIARPTGVSLPIVDLSGLPAARRATEARRLALAEAQRPFDLARGPLIRQRLLRTETTAHVLLLTMHHIVADAWSVGVLVREIAALYPAYLDGQPAPLPDLPIQYADYAVWQRQWLQGEPLERQRAYWRKQLANVPMLTLPADHPRPAAPTFHGAVQTRVVAPALTGALKALGRAAEATLFMTLLAAFQALLYRYTGQTDIAIGSAIANRRWAEIENLIGFFVNTLVMRTDLSGKPSFRELIGRVQRVCLAAYAHQDIPFEMLVEELQPERDLSRQPLFQVAFVLQNAPAPALQLTDLSVELFEGVDQVSAKYDLTLSATEQPHGLSIWAEYSTDLFEATTITRWLEHFERLLRGLAAQPDQPIDHLPLLTEAERHQVLLEWNDTKSGIRSRGSGVRTIQGLFEAQAVQTPDAIACVTMNDEERTMKRAEGSFIVHRSSFIVQLSYAELNRRANQLAHHLRALGAGPETLVGLCAERSLELVVGLLGILRAGAAYVPLDPAYPSERISFMLEDSGARVLIVATNRHSDKVTRRQGDKETDAASDVTLSPPHLVTGSRQAVVDLGADWPLIARQPDSSLDSGAGPDNAAYAIYTSGSTGQPKGALNTHRAIANRLLWMQASYALTPGDRVVQKTPFSFDVSIWELFWPLITGACLVLAQPEGHKDSAYLVRLMRAQQITISHFVPSMLRIFLAEPGLAACRSLTRVFCSGEALPVDVQSRFFERLNCELHNLYGPTETAVEVTSWACRPEPRHHSVPIGRPIANLRMYILDAHHQPVPIGVPGELHIGGIAVGRGYLNRPDLTAERFIPNPFSQVSGVRGRGSGVRSQESEDARCPEGAQTNDERHTAGCRLPTDQTDHLVTLSPCHLVTAGTRLYKTGDLARYRPDGAIEFLGRLDHQVKLRGYRVELGEIEARLSRHPAVREAVVVAREDQPGDTRLVAYVVQGSGVRGQESEARSQPSIDDGRTTKDERPTFEDRGLKIDDSDVAPSAPLSSILYPLSSELRSYLAKRLPQYMLPSHVVFLERLPLLPNGKLDRRALPAPSEARSEGPEADWAPRTPVEELLAALWAQVLGVRRIGRHDHFFALGGHSLLATQVISRVRATFHVEIPLRRLFETPTPAGLAEAIEAAQQIGASEQGPRLERAARHGGLPLSYAQQRLWFLDQLLPGLPAYNLPLAVHLSGPLDRPALAQSLDRIAQRHEILRTTFRVVAGRPLQAIAPAIRGGRRLAVVDLCALPEAHRAQAARSLMREQALRPFDLARGPLIRACLLQSAPAEHLFVLTMHHIISDGWSLGVLVDELTALYSALAAGQRARLSELPLQYADYAAWQRAWLQEQDGLAASPLQVQMAYWKRQLADAPALHLPTDRPRPAVQTFRGGVERLQFSDDLAGKLRSLGQREGTTLFMTLLAAFQTLLYRYSRQSDSRVGTPIANRTRAELEGLIGFFVNTLVLRTDMKGNPPFDELLGRVRDVCLGAYAHQDLPFEKLVEELQPARSLSYQPLFQVMFVLQNAPTRPATLPGITWSPVELPVRVAKFDLTVFLWEDDHGLQGELEYNPDLFVATTIRRMAGHFQSILEGIVADAGQRLADLSLLAPGERQQLLVEWNNTTVGVRSQESGVRSRLYGRGMPRPYLPSDAWCVHELVERQAAHAPDAVALAFETTNDQRRSARGRGSGVGDQDDMKAVADPWPLTPDPLCLTYGELDRRANQLAHHLRRLGVGPEALVGLCVERSVELVIGALGILKVGGAYMPLDPAYPTERISFMLEDSGAAVMVTKDVRCPEGAQTNDERRTTNERMTADCRLPTDKTDHLVTLSPCHLVNLGADWPAIARQPATEPPGGATAGNLAYVIYTSGSTGRPKGVPIEHRGLLNLVDWHRQAFAITAADRAAQIAGLGFDASVWELWPYLATGASVHLPTQETRLSPRLLRDWLVQQAITVAFVPTPLAEHALALEWPRRPALRVLLTGGDTLHRYPAPDLPFSLVNNYGPTENTVVATAGRISAPAPGETAPGIGRPIQYTQVYILDQHFNPVPAGMPGELHIGGAGIARGYLNAPDLTAERFVPNPFANCKLQIADCRLANSTICNLQSAICNRLYRTGDLARYRPDGELEFLGRIDQQVKIRGFRIELGEITAVLRSHPAVREALVLVSEDASGEKRLVAYVVPAEGAADRGQGTGERRTTNDESVTLSPCHLVTLSESAFVTDLRSFLKSRLPDYMLPSAFVFLEELPITPNGKVSRQELPALKEAGPTFDQAYVPPQTTLEQLIAQVWQRVLRVEHVGLHDNFFDLGGHSLGMVQAHNQLQEVFGDKLALVDLFHYPTVHTLANYLAQDAERLNPALQIGRDVARARREALRQRASAQDQRRASRREGGRDE